MPPSRGTVLAATLAVTAIGTVWILQGLLGTVFFAITVATVLLPISRRLVRAGLPSWWAAATATAGALLFGIGLFVPVGFILYVRRRAALTLLRSLPDSLTLAFEEFTYVVEVGDLTAFVARQLTRLAFSIAEGMPVIAVKLVVFAFVVFGLLSAGDRLRRAVLAPVPDEYHHDLERLHGRIEATLYSIYVIQAATAIGTFAIALAVFLALDIQFPVTLAVLAGLFQFLPVIGPSVVIGGLVVADLLAGDLTGAVLIGVVGVLLIGFLPDAVLRPWLAQETVQLPSALYFVGLTGGLLSLGPIGVVAGPLIVVILLELLAMLAEERPSSPADPEPAPDESH